MNLPASDVLIPPIPATQASLPVVVAVAEDGSAAALRFAADEAVVARAHLLVVHVVDLVAPAPAIVVEGGAGRAGVTIIQAVRRARAAVAGVVGVSDELFHGDVVDGLVDASRRARLLVLERRRAGADRVGPGGVCARVASAAGSGVVCVPSDWDGGRSTRPGQTVTVGVRDALTCAPLLAEALAVAAVRGDLLRVVHVREPEGADDPEDEADLARAVAVALKRATVMPRPQVVVETMHGAPAAALVEASRTSRLVVVGRHRPRRPHGGSSLGPVARATLRGSVCPVLVATPAHSVSSVEWFFSGHLE